MIAFRATKTYWWRNIYAEHPVQAVDIELAGDGWTAAAVPEEFRLVLRQRLPGLSGDLWTLDAAAFTAELARLIQNLNDPVPPVSGVRTSSADGTQATFFFACREPGLGAVTAQLAVALADAIAADGGLTPAGLEAMLDRLAEQLARAGLSPSGRAVAAAAERRDIPWFRIGSSQFLQLGQGHRQRRTRDLMGSGESGPALALAANNQLSLRVLGGLNLPVGRSAAVRDAADTAKAAETVGYPLVLKPALNDGHTPERVVRSAAELEAAMESAAGQQREFLLQRLLPGQRHHILVVSGRLIAAMAESGAAGAAAQDVTEKIHPANAEAAIQAATAIGLRTADVVFLSPDISRPWKEAGGIHAVAPLTELPPYWPDTSARDLAGPVVETMFAPGNDGRIPTAMITGTKGKSTTVLMLSSILACAGHTVGATTTDGVIVADRMIGAGDASAVMGASAVIQHPAVTAAVLETARGGLLLRGVYLAHCDVAALLNVDREQIEIDGVETLDEMARLKRKVLETARRAIVLNADDERCAAMADDFPSLRKFLFSMRPNSLPVTPHISKGNTVLSPKTVDGREVIVVAEDGRETVLLATDEIPATMDGIVRCNVANAMAAAALALGLGVPEATIAAGLRRYDTDLDRARGRFSFLKEAPVRTLFDRAAEAISLRAAVEALQEVPVSGRRICALTAAGNRPHWHYDEMAQAVVSHFDVFVCFERPDLYRGRAPGEISQILKEALIGAGVPAETVAAVPSNREAAEIVARTAQPGDFVTVFYSDIRTSPAEYRDAYARHHKAP